MNYWQTTLVILASLYASLALAEDFKTTGGKEYKDASVIRVEPDGIMVKTKSAITKIYFVELPREVQKRFNYDPQNAAAFSAQQVAASAVNQNQQQKELEERQHQQDAAVAQGAEVQAAWNRSRNLQDRYQVLQQQENALQQQIDDARKPGPGYYLYGILHHHPNPAASQLPSLYNQLADVRSEKNKVASELNKPQR